MSSSESELSSSLSSDSSYLSTCELPPENGDQAANMYDDSLKPIANEEELSEYLEQVAIEEDEEEEFRKRFSNEVNVQSWCSCSNCSLSLVFKPEECICCHEMLRCIDKIEEAELDDQACIKDHPGFRNVCLDKYVLEVAAIGLKTKSKKSYVTLYKNGNKSESQFLRSVAYRQVFRFIWGYMGNDMRKPLPSCIYNHYAIRTEFPSQDGNYKGFQEEEDSIEEAED